MANYFLLLLVVCFALTKETVLGDNDPSEIQLEGFDPNDPAHQKALKAFQNVLDGKSEPTLYESVKSNLASYAPNLRSLSSNLPTSYIPSLPSPSSYLPSSWSWTPTNYLPSWGTVIRAKKFPEGRTLLVSHDFMTLKFNLRNVEHSVKRYT
ncbi:uncharacterized protein LOC113466250 [Diaphorina citri]|uniref:Uncharacterized protein LOC113466250 n=1 Tax=Diaphorina citri TaxID=121845 RepID=A0A3Q0IRM7_DIACI|nr:uncharacterized protein LOC113466250 [Diaphorina citri]